MDANIGYAAHGCGLLDPDNHDKRYCYWADEPDGCEQYHSQMEESGVDDLARAVGVMV